jgi:hypothetical protein
LQTTLYIQSKTHPIKKEISALVVASQATEDGLTNSPYLLCQSLSHVVTGFCYDCGLLEDRKSFQYYNNTEIKLGRSRLSTMARMYKSEGAARYHNTLGTAHNPALIGVRSFDLPYRPLSFINSCESRFPLYAIVFSS